MARLRAWLLRDTWALPIDLFRLLVGLLAIGYFAQLLLETSDFSSPSGLLDHAFLADVLWFTRWSLFQPGLPSWVFYGAYGLGVAGAVAIVLGERVKIWALVLFLIAASHSRWNFVVIFIDDAVMHLCLFWLLILPVGRTLVLREWLRDGRAAIARWSSVTVPGVSIRCFQANICLMYVTAGLCKLGSQYWLSGFAVYAVLRQPIAWTPDLWTPEMLPWIRVASYMALAIELVLPFLLTRSRGSTLKWLAVPLMAVFHLGIVLTLRIPFANLAMLASVVVFFGPEMMARMKHRSLEEEETASVGLAGTSALALVAMLGLAMLRGIPVVGEIHRPAYAILWTFGVAQDYHLFGWIDGINYHATNRARLDRPDGSLVELPAAEVLPRSLRYTLLQAYVERVPWMPFPAEQRSEFRRRVIERLRVRTCTREDRVGTVEFTTEMTRITPGDPALRRVRPSPPVTFQCEEKTRQDRSAVVYTAAPLSPRGDP